MVVRYRREWNFLLLSMYQQLKMLSPKWNIKIHVGSMTDLKQLLLICPYQSTFEYQYKQVCASSCCMDYRTSVCVREKEYWLVAIVEMWMYVLVLVLLFCKNPLQGLIIENRWSSVKPKSFDFWKLLIKGIHMITLPLPTDLEVAKRDKTLNTWCILAREGWT